MTLFVDNSNGYISFGDTDIHPKPKGAIDLTNEEHRTLLLAQNRGATISIVDGKLVLTDFSGKEIDITKVTEMSNFSAPISISQIANAELSWSRTEAAYIVARGKVFSSEMSAYIDLLENIVSGKDTITKTLPSRPTKISE